MVGLLDCGGLSIRRNSRYLQRCNLVFKSKRAMKVMMQPLHAETSAKSRSVHDTDAISSACTGGRFSPARLMPRTEEARHLQAGKLRNESYGRELL